jgi:NAD(P)-dependent dehydrogenase (short-subunit alcohol dehydrogenase family)
VRYSTVIFVIVEKEDAPMALLEGKTAVVTGAGHGIGAAIAKGFSAEGATVVIVDNDGTAAENMMEEIIRTGGRASCEVLDITDRSAGLQCAKHVSERHGAVHVLVNNAGIAPRVKLTDDNFAEMWDQVLEVNLTGQMNVTLAFLPAMKQEGGSLIYTVSIAGFTAPRSSAGYGAAKAGLRSVIQYFAQELAPFNIRVNGLAPGRILTDMTVGAVQGANGAKFLERVPLARNGDPSEMAGPAIFLASSMSSYVCRLRSMQIGGMGNLA